MALFKSERLDDRTQGLEVINKLKKTNTKNSYNSLQL